MDKRVVAKELVRIASLIVGLEFETEAEKKRYLKQHKPRPGTKLVVKPKKVQRSKPLSKSEHTHSVGKLSPDDQDETRIRIYDSGSDGAADHLTAVIEGKDWDATANPGFKPMLGFGAGGRGVSQWSEGKEGKHLGKPVRWEDLDADSQAHVMKRLKQSGS